MNSVDKISELPISGLNVAKVAEIVEGQYIGPDIILNKEISGVEINSKKIVKDNIFAAFVGEKVDGNDYIANAIEAGALVALTDKPDVDVSQPIIKVHSVSEAIAKLATYYRATLDIPIVGVVGSVGKTSTKESIASILSNKFNVLKTEGNYNNLLGLPLTLLRIKNVHDVAVVEMGISEFGEMTKLAQIARPDIVVFTNVCDCHLDTLRNKAGVLQAKSEVFNYMHNDNSVAIINADDEYLEKIHNVKGKAPVTFGINENLDNYVTDLQLNGLGGSSGLLHIWDKCAEFKLALPGIHSIYNMLAGSSVANVLGMSIDEIVSGVQNCQALAGHGQTISTNKITILDEAYNANPKSMRAAIDLLGQAIGRKVAIIGGMNELGVDSDKLHFELGKYLVSQNIDVIILIGQETNPIFNGAQRGPIIRNLTFIGNKQNLIDNLDKYIQEGDTVLVKASNSFGFSEIVDALKKF